MTQLSSWCFIESANCMTTKATPQTLDCQTTGESTWRCVRGATTWAATGIDLSCTQEQTTNRTEPQTRMDGIAKESLVANDKRGTPLIDRSPKQVRVPYRQKNLDGSQLLRARDRASRRRLRLSSKCSSSGRHERCERRCESGSGRIYATVPPNPRVGAE